MEVSHTAVEQQLLERVLPPGARVLDAGCGRTTRLAAHRDRIVELIGVDIDGAARTENGALDRFFCADLCGVLPFDDASFDAVYSNFVVEHLHHPSAAFEQWHRVLRRNGHLVLLTSNRANPLLAASALAPDRARVAIKRAGAGVTPRDVIALHRRANTPWRLHAQLRRAGFDPVEVHYVATLHRYGERYPALAALLRSFEHALPPVLRSTIVGCYRR